METHSRAVKSRERVKASAVELSAEDSDPGPEIPLPAARVALFDPSPASKVSANELENATIPEAASEDVPEQLPQNVSSADLFDPFAGYSFLYFFQIVEFLFGWMRPGRRRARTKFSLGASRLNIWRQTALK